jgi:hypothetical protein
MINTNEKSDAQGWELEVTCKNKMYLEAIVSAILRCGLIEFEVRIVDIDNKLDLIDVIDGRYIVFMWGSWFSNLRNMSNVLADIEDMYK